MSNQFSNATVDLQVEYTVVDGIYTRLLKVEGKGPTLLFIHGYTDSADTWRAVLKRQQLLNRSAIAIDLPHHGEAEELSEISTIEALDKFIAAAIKLADHGEGVILVGNSLGALLSVRAAQAQFPSLLSALALGAPGNRIHPALEPLLKVAPILLFFLRYKGVINPVTKWIISEIFVQSCIRKKVTPQLKSRYSNHLKPQVLAEQVKLGAKIVPNLSTILAGFEKRSSNMRITLWWGSDDLICPVRGAGPYNNIGRIQIIEGAPHCPQLSDPDLVLSIIDDHEAWSKSKPSSATK
ncbi:MAG: alpha/beta fold hydrolase [Mycobacteriaceae bacterium]